MKRSDLRGIGGCGWHELGLEQELGELCVSLEDAVMQHCAAKIIDNSRFSLGLQQHLDSL